MRIAVLARGLDRPGGVSRLARGLLASLPAAAPNDHFVFLIDAPLSETLVAPNVTPLLLPRSHPAIFDHYHAPRAARREAADVFLAPKNTVPLGLACPTVCIFLDLAYFAMPEAYGAIDNVYMRAMFRRSARRASRIAAISDSTRRDVVRYLGDEAASRARVVYPGLDAIFERLPREVVAAARERMEHLPRRFVLYAGNISPRKNLARLLEAFARVDCEVALVMTGHRAWKSGVLGTLIERARATHDVRVLGPVSDFDLVALYNLAEASVYPSLYEGFGFPVLESFACGTPVVAAATASIPEVAGDAALLVDALDARALGQALLRVTSDAGLRETLAASGARRAREFTWDRTAREMMALIREAV